MKILLILSKSVLKSTDRWLLGLAFVACLASGCSEDTVDFQETGTITGTVISEQSLEPIANAEVSTNPSSSTVFTNENGDFIINDVLVDSYAVQAEASGFTTGFESVTVTADNISNVAFQLETAEQDNLPPSTPQLVVPEDGATNIDIQVQLEWFSIDPEGDELNFIVELRNGSNGEIEPFEVIADSTLVVSGLSLSTTYFWQVIVSDAINEPIGSTIRQFTTSDSPINPILFVREIDNNNVIFSGDQQEGSVDFNVFQLTDESFNSFNPHKDDEANRIAFLRTVAGESQLFTMDLGGQNVQQLTFDIPVRGFRNDAIDYTWHNSGAQLLYPNFDRLISINNDGTGSVVKYVTPDNSLISEVVSPDFDTDLVVLKTNDLMGYNVRIVLVRLSTGMEEVVILEGAAGAAGGIDITASGDEILFFRDLSEDINDDYRIFMARPFIYYVPDGTTLPIETDVNLSQNVLDTSFLPTEGGIIFTRVANDNDAVPNIFTRSFDANTMSDNLLFTGSFLPDFE